MSQTESEWPWTPRCITDGVQLGLSKGPWTPRCITDGVQGALPGPPWTPRCITESVMQKSSGGGTCHRRSPRALDSKVFYRRSPGPGLQARCPPARFGTMDTVLIPLSIDRWTPRSKVYYRRSPRPSARGPGLRDVFQTEPKGPWTPRCIPDGVRGALDSEMYYRRSPRGPGVQGLEARASIRAGSHAPFAMAGHPTKRRSQGVSINVLGSVPNNIRGGVPNNIRGGVPNNIQYCADGGSPTVGRARRGSCGRSSRPRGTRMALRARGWLSGARHGWRP